MKHDIIEINYNKTDIIIIEQKILMNFLSFTEHKCQPPFPTTKLCFDACCQKDFDADFDQGGGEIYHQVRFSH